MTRHRTAGLRMIVRGRHLVNTPWMGGVVLLIFVAVALALANIPATAGAYHELLTTPLSISVGDRLSFSLDIEKFINDGLMVVFFFVVGLEIKRELLVGRLSTPRQALLPIAAAVGGMVVPGAIYAIFNAGGPYEAGWGIPMATDIAFAIAVLALLGERVPASLKVFLTALAIVDDLGAIVVIAIFYTYKINWVCLAVAVALMGVVWLMRRGGLTRIFPYMAVAVAMWFLFYASGVHATISGVLMAMLIPTKPLLPKKVCVYRQRQILEEFRFCDREGVEVWQNEEQHRVLLRLRRTATDAIGMSQRMEHLLNPWVSYLVMPVFALANAGVAIHLGELDPFAATLGTGIFLGLVAGKPLGILAGSWLAVKSRIAVLPRGVKWPPMVGVACMGGIGFTMSIFIDTLAFAGNEAMISSGKITILVASLCSAAVGALAAASFNWARNRNKSKYLRRSAHNVSEK